MADLYRWGMEVWAICAFYDIHKVTLKAYLKRVGVNLRPSGKPRHCDLDVKSNRRHSPEERAARTRDLFEDAYQPVRRRARDLRDMHIARRQERENIRSYLAGLSLPPSVFWRIDIRLRARG